MYEQDCTAPGKEDPANLTWMRGDPLACELQPFSVVFHRRLASHERRTHRRQGPAFHRHHEVDRTSQIRRVEIDNSLMTIQRSTIQIQTQTQTQNQNPIFSQSLT